MEDVFQNPTYTKLAGAVWTEDFGPGLFRDCLARCDPRLPGLAHLVCVLNYDHGPDFPRWEAWEPAVLEWVPFAHQLPERGAVQIRECLELLKRADEARIRCGQTSLYGNPPLPRPEPLIGTNHIMLPLERLLHRFVERGAEVDEGLLAELEGWQDGRLANGLR